MRLLKIMIGLIIVLALSYMLYKNSSQPVTIWLLPGLVLSDIDMTIALVGTLAIGILLGFAVGLIQIMSQQSVVRRQGHQLKKLRTELNTLRHSPLSVDLFDPDTEKPADAVEIDSSPEKQDA